MKFTVGKAGDVDLRGHLDSLIYSRLLVQANSGGGKSWCIRRLLEQTHGHVQHLVIDPEGEFSTLRERFDYVLAARQGGDTVADPRAARLLAERLLELQVSAVLDIYELKAHERVRFVRLFLEALIEAPKKLWRPVLVVVDEAHVFCPQKGEAESASAVIDLATRGRKRGFCAILATQRLSKLHKDAAAECNNKLIGRSALDVDMARAADELGFTGKDEQRKLRELHEGEFYAFGPAFTRQVTLVKVGPVQTTHPRAGGRLAFTAPPPTAKVKALLPKLADLPAEEEKRRVSETELRRRIAELERELKQRVKGVLLTAKEPKTPKRVEVLILKDAQVKRLEAAVDRARDMAATLLKRHAHQVDQLSQRLQVVVSEAGLLQDQIWAAGAATRDPDAMRAGGGRGPLMRASSGEGRRAATSRPAPVVPRPPRVNAEGNGRIARAHQKILDRLAWLASVGISQPDRGQLALWCDLSPTSGGFFNYLGALRSAGLIQYPTPGTVALTDEGQAHANPPEALTVREMQESLFRKVGESKAKLLRVLIQSYPDAVSKDDLADAVGMSRTSGGYFNYLGALRSLGVIDYPTPGQVVAKPVLFLEASA